MGATKDLTAVGLASPRSPASLAGEPPHIARKNRGTHFMHTHNAGNKILEPRGAHRGRTAHGPWAGRTPANFFTPRSQFTYFSG
jgi:hypothetical protein